MVGLNFKLDFSSSMFIFLGSLRGLSLTNLQFLGKVNKPDQHGMHLSYLRYLRGQRMRNALKHDAWLGITNGRVIQSLEGSFHHGIRGIYKRVFDKAAVHLCAFP